MENYANSFVALGFVPIGAWIRWDELACRKVFKASSAWQRATLGTYKEFIDGTHNGLAVVTGEASDLIVIDCDLLKDSEKDVRDGVALFKELIDMHEIPENTPIQRSASGGMHYFFSLSKSVEAGLMNTKNCAKLMINNQATSIDVRAEGGCIIVDPTTIQSQKYKFVQPLVDRDAMPTMPDWCIEILNENLPKNTKSTMSMDICRQLSALTLTQAPISTQNIRADDLYKEAKECIEDFLGTEIASKWLKTYGFNFKPRSIVECALCGNTHTNNSYIVKQIIEECFSLKNFSKDCRPKAFNYESHESLRKILREPSVDQPYAMLLNASFRSRDFMLVHAYDLKRDRGRFMCFNGHIWQEISKHRVLCDIADTCGTILDTLLIQVQVPPEMDPECDEAVLIQKQHKQFKRGRAYIEKNTNTKNILEYYRTLYTDEVLESKLDKNPDILVVRNGVIDLQTGELRDGLPSDYMSRQLDIDYLGITASTELIDNFIGDLFNFDNDSVEYLQRLLGYGITGRTDSQVWVMFTGEGSNGKSLLASLLEALLEDWFVTAPYEIFFRGDKRATEGAHSAHLGTIRNARICVKEEAEPKERLNTESLKTITGGSSITMRGAYAKDYETFKPITLPILLCNHRPEVDTTDPAMMRRIVVVPFHNIYTTPDDQKRPHDENNPHHRLRDPEIKNKLLKEHAREQLLTWLVRGAVAWFKNKNLTDQPPVMKRAYQVYNDENDKLQIFIDTSCEIGKDFAINAKLFREMFSSAMQIPIMQTKLAQLMKEKKFMLTRFRINGKMERGYKGLRFIGHTGICEILPDEPENK